MFVRFWDQLFPEVERKAEKCLAEKCGSISAGFIFLRGSISAGFIFLPGIFLL
jgi:hypothetical protein